MESRPIFVLDLTLNLATGTEMAEADASRSLGWGERWWMQEPPDMEGQPTVLFRGKDGWCGPLHSFRP